MGALLRLVVVILAAFAVAIAYWAVKPWDDVLQLATPQGAPQQFATFHCGAAWGKASVSGPTSTPLPVTGTPCHQREERRRLAAVDVGLAVTGIGVLLPWDRRRRIEAEEAADSIANAG